MKTNRAGLQLIEAFEGFSPVQYRDAIGVPTIGFGTTAAVISPLPARCTRAQAETWLAQSLAAKYEPPVNGLHVKLNQNQFDALVSLVYNCGPGAMDWQIGRDLKAGDYTAAARDFDRYVYAGGRVLQGLVNRRAAERKLFETRVALADPEHYRWYDHSVRELTIAGRKVKVREVDTVQRYDDLRAQQTPAKHPHRAELDRLKLICKQLADRISSVAEVSGWDKYQRRFRHDELIKRSKGQRVA